MPEYRKIFNLPAAKLSRSDIKELGGLICDGLRPPRVPTSKHHTFELSSGEASFRADSIDELLAQSLPDSIDGLRFSAYGWDGEKIDRSVEINLHRTIASSHVHSIDEVWFKGKEQQIVEFFSARRPWYGALHSKWALLFGVMLLSSMINEFLYGLSHHQFLLATGTGIASIILAISFWMLARGRLFPLMDIRLNDVTHRSRIEIAMVIFTAIGSLATLVNTIFPFLPKDGS